MGGGDSFEKETAGSFEDELPELSPIDRYRLALELPERRTEDEKATARKNNAWEALSMLPVTGNAISAYEAPGTARDTGKALDEGRWGAAAGNAALTGLNILGAVTGLPLSKASRTPRVRLVEKESVDDNQVFDIMQGFRNKGTLSGRDRGDTFHVQSIDGTGDELGREGLRGVTQALSREFPSVTKVSGHRISGARRQAGSERVVTADIARFMGQEPPTPLVDRLLPTWGMAGQAAKGAKDRVNIFAGPEAKTADKAALARAEELRAAGADRDAIWQETGWFTGPDGKWRFEIDDSAARLRNDRPTVDSFGYETGTAGAPMNTFDGLDHPALSKAYDFEHELEGLYGPGIQYGGVYNPDAFMMGARGSTADQARSAALHEHQHAVQMQEGFTAGATPESSNVMGKGLDYDDYRRVAGEVEARNVQTRRDMTAEQRRQQPPWTTQDTPDDQQLFGEVMNTVNAWRKGE